MTESNSQLRTYILGDDTLRKTAMERITLRDREILFHRGDPGDAFYVIETGQIRIFTCDRDGQEMTLNLLEAGDSFGELALLDAQPRSASAIALGDCTLLCLRREDFLRHLHNSPILNQYVLQLVCDRARHMTDYIEQLGHWMTQIIDGNYKRIIKTIETANLQQQDPSCAAVADCLIQALRAVQQREENLLQSALKIEIDEDRRRQKVEEITETDYFQDLLLLSRQIRQSGKMKARASRN